MLSRRDRDARPGRARRIIRRSVATLLLHAVLSPLCFPLCCPLLPPAAMRCMLTPLYLCLSPAQIILSSHGVLHLSTERKLQIRRHRQDQHSTGSDARPTAKRGLEAHSFVLFPCCSALLHSAASATAAVLPVLPAGLVPRAVTAEVASRALPTATLIVLRTAAIVPRTAAPLMAAASAPLTAVAAAAAVLATRSASRATAVTATRADSLTMDRAAAVEERRG